MKKLTVTLVCIALAFALVGCSTDEPSRPVENPTPPPVAEPTKAPQIDSSTAIVAITLPPLFSAEKTDDEITIEAAAQGVFDISINDDGSITYRMTMDERDRLLEETRVDSEHELAALTEGGGAAPSFRGLSYDAELREFEVKVDPALWDSIHSFWSMEIYKPALRYQAVNGVPLDDMRVVVRYVDVNTGELIFESDSRAENA